MSRVTQIQLLLLVMIMGFLTGPRMTLLAAKLSAHDDVAHAENIAQLAAAETPTHASASPENQSPYAALDLKARGVYVWDIKTHRKLFAQNERASLPLASVTKMMMALVATEILPPDTDVTITPVDLSEEGDSGLRAGERWTLADLLKFTLVASSNDGASAIAGVAGATLNHNASSSDPFANKKLFIQKMNAKARVIGLENTTFANESGLDIESVAAGAYGSPRDMAVLFEYIFKKHPELFTPTTYAKLDITSEDNIVHHVANTNAGVEHVTGIIGSKTGYTDLAGGNLVVLVDIGLNHPIVIAVLGSTRDGRFTDVEQLINATVKEITSPQTHS